MGGGRVGKGEEKNKEEEGRGGGKNEWARRTSGERLTKGTKKRKTPK